MITTEAIQDAYREIQECVTEYLLSEDDTPYREDRWGYRQGRGGGITRVWEGENLLEKGSLTLLGVQGARLPSAVARCFDAPGDTPFFLSGVTLVLHPLNPYVPGVLMDLRYFETSSHWWFTGGISLVPAYPVVSEVVEYHRALKKLCDKSGEDYLRHKAECDSHLSLDGREEALGVGGVFLGRLAEDKERNLAFVRRLGMGFPKLYQPLVNANRNRQYGKPERAFQLYRRSRFVEFLLTQDHSTLLGLRTGLPAEAIFAALPGVAKWTYQWTPQPGTPEARLAEFFLKPQDWVNLNS